MSWASKRKTTRIEDEAYCLLGIFDVNIPLIYGEGAKAFYRLQEEIIKYNDDESIFAWGRQDDLSHVYYRVDAGYDSNLQSTTLCSLYSHLVVTRGSGLLAKSTRYFETAHDVVPHQVGPSRPAFANSHHGITLYNRLRESPGKIGTRGSLTHYSVLMPLHCRRRHDLLNILAIPIAVTVAAQTCIFRLNLEPTGIPPQKWTERGDSNFDVVLPPRDTQIMREPHNSALVGTGWRFLRHAYIFGNLPPGLDVLQVWPTHRWLPEMRAITNNTPGPGLDIHQGVLSNKKPEFRCIVRLGKSGNQRRQLRSNWPFDEDWPDLILRIQGPCERELHKILTLDAWDIGENVDCNFDLSLMHGSRSSVPSNSDGSPVDMGSCHGGNTGSGTLVVRPGLTLTAECRKELAIGFLHIFAIDIVASAGRGAWVRPWDP